MTKGQRIARERLQRHLAELEADRPDWDRIRRLVPDDWHRVAQDVDVEERKEKVTLYLDRSVVRVFRAMGLGYHARINRLLATWVQMQAGGWGGAR
jgi:uncharacterized protein (DUF4415 family)